ncbi:unnamed protein product [Caenorhabditis angaria]|uniref:Uncharacterized protein n=1 Tax=Caenorhabditis angaria TaxID=860376 RepID=A0A9P1I558_9PELO|nr:unnamed protein product [Caenorhabditis angaria]
MVGFQMSYSHIIAPFTPLEWNRARELYKSREKSELEELVRMITMWISRSIANAPVAINCSKVLLNAILADFHFETLADSEKGTYIDNLLTAHGHGITRLVLGKIY